MATSGGEEPPPGEDLRLTYSPPVLENPVTVTVPETSAGGHFQRNLTAGQDAIIVLPATKRIGNVTVSGGRHVVIVGGEIEIQATPGTDQQRRAFYFLNQTGHIFVQGVHIHRNAAGADYDAFYIRDDASTIQKITVQDCLITGIDGTFAGWHGDAFQTQTSSAVQAVIEWDRNTVKGNYQLYYVQDQGQNSEAFINRTNFVCTGNNGVALYFGDNGTQTFARKNVNLLEGVYLDHTLGGTFESEVRPGPAATLVEERPVVNSGVMTWPNSAYLTGELRSGLPPSGDYATADRVGLTYENPGYLGE